MRYLGFTAIGLGLALAGAPMETVRSATQTATPKAAAPKAAAPKPAAKPTKRAAAKPPASRPGVIESGSLEALRRMSGYLSGLPALEVTSNSSLDLVTNDSQRIQVDAVVNYKVRKPDGFVINFDSAGKKRTYYYDGKQFTLYAPELGFYSTAPAPPTNEQTLRKLEDTFGISLPLVDLFHWNDAVDNPADKVTGGYLVGAATIDGVTTDHYAFRQANVDWQIWIQQGERPLPLKVMIVDKTDTAHPAYIARLKWNVSPTLSDADFIFKPSASAMQIRMSELAR